MPTHYKISLGLATLFFFAIVGLCGWCFLYTRDLPDIGHLSEFAPTQGHLATDSCLSGLSFAVPFERIGKSFQMHSRVQNPESRFLTK
jgi:hypothetical protein